FEVETRKIDFFQNTPKCTHRPRVLRKISENYSTRFPIYDIYIENFIIDKTKLVSFMLVKYTNSKTSIYSYNNSGKTVTIISFEKMATSLNTKWGDEIITNNMIKYSKKNLKVHDDKMICFNSKMRKNTVPNGISDFSKWILVANDYLSGTHYIVASCNRYTPTLSITSHRLQALSLLSILLSLFVSTNYLKGRELETRLYFSFPIHHVTTRYLKSHPITHLFYYCIAACIHKCCMNGPSRNQCKKKIEMSHLIGMLFEEKLMENLVLNFFNLRYKHKHFYAFSTTKLLANFHNFEIFRKRQQTFFYQHFKKKFSEKSKFQFSINSSKSKWVPLCCTLGTVWITIIYYRSVKFESNDRYHCIRKTILNEDDLSA
ncbi:hypothetical protein AGLY_012680, partial [Aphis glycines]